MQQSRLSFASPNFRSQTIQSNPQDTPMSNQKSFQDQQVINPSQQMSFKKPLKQFLFPQYQSESDLQAQSTSQIQQNTNSRKVSKSDKKTHFKNKAPDKENFSPQMVELLSNCKASIETLQQQLAQKSSLIKGLEKEKTVLSAKLLESEKQVQRIQQILNIYIKQSKDINTKIEIQRQSQQNISLKDLESKYNELLKVNQSIEKENQHLRWTNTELQTEVSQINTENFILSQKLQKMGKGVGQALSTIKKNNQSSEKVSEFLLVSEGKPSSNFRQHGKILTHSKKNPKNVTSEKNFETPAKVSTFFKNVSFYEASQQRMTDISIKAKRLDQLQKLEDILNKMQKLTESEDEN